VTKWVNEIKILFLFLLKKIDFLKLHLRTVRDNTYSRRLHLRTLEVNVGEESITNVCVLKSEHYLERIGNENTCSVRKEKAAGNEKV